ncbi:hypothetical protein VTK73DRAFT_1598 [Phialemonium thermophilum]|uniref:SAP domain-containing protein n=1 Tax=Phialemonium thermophilum TaxID=223376 RepID=A0ABR3Y462_9PEZI
MAEYSTMKVTELKKLLTERKLSTAGNKPDLIARLEEDDKAKAGGAEPAAKPAAKPEAEDEIDYDDDDIAPSAAAGQPAATQADAPATKEATDKPSSAAPANQTESAQAPTTETATAPASNAAAEQPPTPAAQNDKKETTAEEAIEKSPAPAPFSQHLAATNPDDEAAKRAARAKRFGLPPDSDEVKLANRAARFGIDRAALERSLDSALPERRKRERERGAAAGGGDKDDEDRRKRRSGAGGGALGGQGRNRPQQQQQQGGRGRGRPDGGVRKPPQSHPRPAGSILDDPTERAKAEARAKRFAATA